jgi:putative ABC transport system ATP-binding protein
MKVDLERVGKRFPFPHDRLEEVTALREVSLAVASGSVCVISGASGSGKSVLLSLVTGMAAPSSGRVCWDGKDLARVAGLAARRGREAGIVFQELPMVAELTVRENLLLGAAVTGRKVEGKAVDGMLDALGLADRFDVLPAALSGGERRRLCVGRGLLCPSRLLVMDEPTSDLDDDWAGRVVDLVMARRREVGATLVVATHDRRFFPHAEQHRWLHAGKPGLVEA